MPDEVSPTWVSIFPALWKPPGLPVIYSLPLALDGLAALLFMGVRAVHHSAGEDETIWLKNTDC